jgi:hypothetical protein
VDGGSGAGSLVAHEPSWPVLQAGFKATGSQLALSIWNLLEIASASDVAQRERRIGFLEAFKPVWALDHVHVRKQEVKRFLWERHYRIPGEDLVSVVALLSQAEAVYAGAKVRLGVTMGTLVDGLARLDVSQHKKLSPHALTFLHKVSDKDWKKRQRDIFVAVVSGVVPDFDPTGRALRKDERQKLVDFCWDNRSDFMAACPTIAVDDALCEVRIDNSRRKPKESDGIDLAHAVMALAYTDVFIVRDGYVASCAEQAQKRLPGLTIARVITDAAQLSQDP